MSAGKIAVDTVVSGGIGAIFGLGAKFKVGDKIAKGISKVFKTNGKASNIINGLITGEWSKITTDAAGSWRTNVMDAVRGARSRTGFLGFSGKTWKKALCCALLDETNMTGFISNAVSTFASDVVDCFIE